MAMAFFKQQSRFMLHPTVIGSFVAQKDFHCNRFSYLGQCQFTKTHYYNRIKLLDSSLRSE
jgi:hypothetical protein